MAAPASSATAGSLDACKAQYEKDVAIQNHCCVVTSIPPDMKAANRRVFEKLCKFQEDINAHGTLPYTPDSAAARKKDKDMSTNGVNYPENALVVSHRQLKQVMPIPDIHKTSDCDTIYRFLIARRNDEKLALQDILYYIAFREKYNLDSILWDREVECMMNGLDGEELLRQVMELLAKKSSSSSKPVKIPRTLLQPGWAAWNCGVDRSGHVIFYERPSPRDLQTLVKRWPCEENAYDCRNPDFHAVTPPYCNLITRVYLRVMEKGRRLSRLMNFNHQYILREGLKAKLEPQCANPGPDSFTDNGGGIDCLVDVGLVKVRQLTSSKYKEAFRDFRNLSVLSQFYFPENMKRMIIVNGGFVFKMIYKFIRPFLDEQTQRKIVLLSATNKVSVNDMQDASSPSPASASQPSPQGDSDDESTEPENTTANFALRTAISEYVEDRFIPSWYGGRLQAVEAPMFYGGSAPRHLTENKHFAEATQLIRGHVLPDLLPDDFLFNSVDEGSPVTEEEWKAYCARMQSVLFVH